MLGADVPARLVERIVVEASRERWSVDSLRRCLLEALGARHEFSWAGPQRPRVILVVGVNGSGKTTTCAKLAHRAIAGGLKPLLGATDTYRAAGAEQLALWGGRLGSDWVAGKTGGDAAAVAFDALDAAIARGSDVLIVDTAGRMHTKEPLMRELAKVRSALAKRLPGAPHDTWIVLDATAGQNAISQVRVFHDAIPLTGAVVSKLDGSSKAGFVFAVAGELGVPVLFAGLGEGPGDLVPFDPESFVDALLAPLETSPGGMRRA